MRNALCNTLVELSANPDFVFLTGDLGYKALEPLRDNIGPRFINAGLAEQNMVSVAAGLARGGLKPWVYSIAPFAYARPYEQIRNDVCFHKLPVRLVGNGGGYGYGVMGSTHHALEDYGALLCLQNMYVFVPAFAADVPAIVHKLLNFPYPAYFRLGAAEEPKDIELPTYAPWRKLVSGGGPTILAVGPLVGPIVAALRELDDRSRPDLWVLSELPFSDVPTDFLSDLSRSDHLIVVEEHVVQGGVGQILAHHLLKLGRAPKQFTHRAAMGYVSGLYGSQKFHRAECGLDAESIVALVRK